MTVISFFSFFLKPLKMASSVVLEAPSSHLHSTTNPLFSSSKFHYLNKNASKFYAFPSKSTVFLTLTSTSNHIRHASGIDSSSPVQEPEPVLELGLDPIRDRRRVVRVAWEKLVRWSRSWRSKSNTDVLQRTNKVLF